jgi:hypothetical protein
MLQKLTELFLLISLLAAGIGILYFKGHSVRNGMVDDPGFFFNRFRLGSLPVTDTICTQRWWQQESSNELEISCDHGSITKLESFGLVANGSAVTTSNEHVGFAYCAKEDVLKEEYNCNAYTDTQGATDYFYKNCSGQTSCIIDFEQYYPFVDNQVGEAQWFTLMDIAP